MESTAWLTTFHKLVLLVGYAALMAVATGLM